jgi:uncharacterized membrane protein
MTGRVVLITVGMLAGAVWVGSLVCLALVSAAARAALATQSRVALFRRIGRLYGIVGTSSLVIALGAGLILAWPPSQFSTALWVALSLSVLLLLITAAGMVQARRMTAHRQRMLQVPEDQEIATRVRRGAALALALRGSIGLVTIVIVAVGAHMLDQ